MFDTLIVETTLDNCNQIRSELQNKYSKLWIIVWQNPINQDEIPSGYITVSNQASGPLEDSLANELIFWAGEKAKELEKSPLLLEAPPI